MTEVRAVIGGVEYRHDQIASCRINRALFSDKTFSVGGCASAELEITLINPQEIPRGTDIIIYARNETDIEWTQQGLFFIDTRKYSKLNSTVTLHCYDAMMKTEQVWLIDGYESTNFPMSQIDAVNDIAYRINVGIDESMVLSELFPVEYPVDEYGEITMREVLSYIASSNAGNFVISKENTLTLVRFADIPQETSYLVDSRGNPIVFGGTRIIV